jgi:hypothetical protein
MTEKEINEIAVLHRAGNTPREIAQIISRSHAFVSMAQRRARMMGLLPPKPKAETREQVRDLVCNSGFKQGRISKVLGDLSDKEQKWAITRAQRDGYETIAEWLTDVVREKYDKENEL